VRWIASCCLVCSLPSTGISNSLVGQSPFSRADSLFGAGDFYKASIAYERAAYLAQSNSDKGIALLGKSHCYKQLKEFGKGLDCLERTPRYGLSDSLFLTISYEKALLAYLNHEYEYAESEMVQINGFFADTLATHSSLILYALILNERNKWEQAKLTLEKWVNGSKMSSEEKASLLSQIEKEYNEKSIPKLKSPDKARKWSSVLPGTGQIYAGHFFDGALNAGLILASLGLAGVAAYYGYYMAALFAGYSTAVKFYMGGMTHVEYLVNRGNHRKKEGFNGAKKAFILSFAADQL